jgi:hypothetical protein
MIFSIISNQGRVLFSKNDAPARVIMHVDVRIVYINILLIPITRCPSLFGYSLTYMAVQEKFRYSVCHIFKLDFSKNVLQLDLDQPNSSSLGVSDLARSYRASSEGASSIDRLQSSQTSQTRLNRPSSTQWNMVSIRTLKGILFIYF